MNYQEQIKSPAWQKKRLEILNLHNFKCEKCGATEKTLHVHHARYITGRKIWEYDNDVLMCLCADCHKEEHEPKTQQNEFEYINDVFDYAEEEFILMFKTFFTTCFCAEDDYIHFFRYMEDRWIHNNMLAELEMYKSEAIKRGE
jgi:hypothetical protein